MLPDDELMLRVQWGSEYAFAELYQRYVGKLNRFFHGMLCRGMLCRGGVRHGFSAVGGGRDGSVAEDLCHETLLRVWQVRARYVPSGTFPAFLFGVARNIWMERQRAARKDWRLDSALSAASDEPPGDTAPDTSAHRHEVDEHIQKALATLPEDQRMAFVLRTIDGLSLEEIAKIMECPVNTVRSRRMLAIGRLRTALKGLFIL